MTDSTTRTLGVQTRAAFITVAGAGHAPFATGTWGSLFALAPALTLLWVARALESRLLLEIGLVVGILISCWLSVIWGRWAVEHYRRKDPKQFVLDEFAGQWVALLGLPLVLDASLVVVLGIGLMQFLLFRAFDIAKVPPAAQLERLPDGWGILLDDLAAGVYANIIGQVLIRFTPMVSMIQELSMIQ